MWLSNVVLANKARSDHCMCVNFTDVNIATPKDYAPLPNIDHLVDAIARFEVMNFMDAYSGYHKIRMYPKDEEKTTVITKEGTFCYTRMLFGWKNASHLSTIGE